MADAVIEGGDGACTTLMLTKLGTSPVCIRADTELGTVSSVEEVDVCYSTASPPATNSDVGLVSQLAVECGQRGEQILQQLSLSLDHLTPQERIQIEDTLLKYADVFALDTSQLGTTVRRMPFALRGQVDRLVREMLDQDVIIPSTSPWASPVVLVRKKDRGVRFCVDYRKLNTITKLDDFPLPRIDDTLDLLSGAKYFTTLDLASGYWQVPMESSSQETAFTTHSGL